MDLSRLGARNLADFLRQGMLRRLRTLFGVVLPVGVVLAFLAWSTTIQGKLSRRLLLEPADIRVPVPLNRSDCARACQWQPAGFLLFVCVADDVAFAALVEKSGRGRAKFPVKSGLDGFTFSGSPDRPIYPLKVGEDFLKPACLTCEHGGQDGIGSCASA
jgi:hypothetical protein